MSRELADLTPETRKKAMAFLVLCRERGLDVLIYNTLRTLEAQARLFRRGRDFIEIQNKAVEMEKVHKRKDLGLLLLNVGPQFERKIVTHAGPGQSVHNYGQAFDFVPLHDGKPVWGTRDLEDYQLWNACGAAVEDAGLEWGGHWKTLKDFPHAQEPGCDWKTLIKGVKCEW